MKIPIDREAFSEFVEQSGIFATAQKYMEQCLKSWYMDEPEQFADDMRADLETVMKNTAFTTLWYRSIRISTLTLHWTL